MNIPLRRGMLLRHQNHIYQVTEFSERHTGKQKPTVHVALRDIRDGHPVDRTLDALLPVQEVPQALRKMQYLYARGATRVFMDSGTFEEQELSGPQVGDRPDFLKEGEEYRVHFVDGMPVLVEVPDIVTLQVKLTAAPGHGIGGGSNITKEATLENGMEVRVPLFIKTGDMIRVDTRTRTYDGKNNA
jgi:elongation factor P